MAISLSTDIVLDVIRAADPERAGAAARRLAEISGEGVAPDFGIALNAAVGALKHPSRDTIHAPEISGNRINRATRLDPDIALRSLLLQKAIEEMLPKASSTSFGAGTAGSIWRSTFAEQISNSIAASVFRSSGRTTGQAAKAERPSDGTQG